MAWSRWKHTRSFVQHFGAGLHGALGRPWFLVGPLVAILALCLAYQSDRPIVLNVGDSYALPYLEGFYRPEHNAEADYAYTSDRATIHLPGIGRGAAQLEVRIGGGLPGVAQVLSAGDIPLARIPAGGGLVTYVLPVPSAASRDGSLELTWTGETASPPGDSRSLGLAVDRVTWIPLRGGITPDWGQVLWVVLAALALYAVARELDLAAPWAAALSALLAAAVAVGVGLARLYLTSYTPSLAGLLVAVALVLPPARWGTRTLFRRLRMDPPPAVESGFWRVTALAALIKLGGVLYPHILVLDVGAHATRVYRFLSGDWASLFVPGSYSLLGQTVGLEGGQFPYSPLFHLLSVPLTLLPISLPLAMGLFNGLLEVARNLLLFLLVVRLTGRPRVGLWAAVFYTFLPAPYYLLSWGNYPTQLGLWAALLLITFLVLSYDRLAKRPPWGWWLALLVLAILSYTVVGVLTVTLLLLLVLLERMMAAGLAQRRRLMAILGGLLFAEALVFLLYHSGFASAFFRETVPAIFQATRTTGLAEVQVDARESLLSNWVANWIFVGNHITDLGVVFALTGVAALLVEPARRRWRPLLLAWLLTFPLFALFSGLVADMVLKHVLFMLPLLCLGGGVLAERLWRRGLAGRVTAIAYTALMVWLSLFHWLDFILVKRH